MELAAMLFVVGSLAVWALLSFGVGKIAARKGRSFVGWFIISLVISPFFGVFLVLLLGESTAKAVRESAQVREVVRVRCPECGGTTKEEADFCPDCGLQFSS